MLFISIFWVTSQDLGIYCGNAQGTAGSVPRQQRLNKPFARVVTQWVTDRGAPGTVHRLVDQPGSGLQAVELVQEEDVHREPAGADGQRPEAGVDVGEVIGRRGVPPGRGGPRQGSAGACSVTANR